MKECIGLAPKFFYYYTITLGEQTRTFPGIYFVLSDILILPPLPPCGTTLWRNLIFLSEPKIQKFWIFGQITANNILYPGEIE